MGAACLSILAAELANGNGYEAGDFYFTWSTAQPPPQEDRTARATRILAVVESLELALGNLKIDPLGSAGKMEKNVGRACEVLREILDNGLRENLHEDEDDG
jgi:hypothetical protein